MSDDWKNNPRLSGMDPQKLSMLQGLADQGLGKNPSELLPFIMGAASKGKNAGLNFSSKSWTSELLFAMVLLLILI